MSKSVSGGSGADQSRGFTQEQSKQPWSYPAADTEARSRAPAHPEAVQFVNASPLKEQFDKHHEVNAYFKETGVQPVIHGGTRGVEQPIRDDSMYSICSDHYMR